MYETDYCNCQTKAVFNFFPKDKSSKYRLNSIQKQANLSNKNNNKVTQKFKPKNYKIKLSQTNCFPNEKAIKSPATSRFNKNNNKNKMVTLPIPSKRYL